ncbi:MAG: hypothetical protein QM621_02945 [Aeromicrobium sp.]|uniref:McrB family protein n=1 Tax=Aeromicrobium sp. TaxID=1871063 RepID=UPI0039E63ACF
MPLLSSLLSARQVTDESDTLDLVRLIGPILHEKNYPALAGAVRSCLATVAPGSVPATVMDWWVKVVTGESANGSCYQLPADIRGDLADAMTALRDIHSDIAPWRWLSARSTVAKGRALIEPGTKGPLSMDYYGNSRIPKERAAWDQFIELFEPHISALRSGRPGPEIADIEDDVKRILIASDIIENSDRWKAIKYRVQQMADFLYDLREETQIWLSHTPDVDVPVLREVPEEMRDLLGDSADVLLFPVLVDPPRPADLESTLDAELERLDTGSRHQVALLLRPWVDERYDLYAAAPALPAISEALHQIPQIESQIEELRQADLDSEAIDEIELYFLEGDFDHAHELIGQHQGDKEIELSTRRWQSEIDAALHRAERVGVEDADLRSLRDDIATLLVDGRESTLREGVREAGERLENQVARLRREEFQRHVKTLETLGTTKERVYDLNNEAKATITRSRLEEMERQVANLRDDRVEEVRRTRERVADALSDPSIDEDRRAELRQSAPPIVDRDSTDVEIMATHAGLLALEAEINKLITRRWIPDRHSEGELLGHLIKYCTERIDYDENDLKRLFVALKTKPFVILAGLTGSGKSSIARLVAEAFGSSAANGRFRRIAVRPDWIDQSDVLGYINPMSGDFEPGWLADVARSCQANPDDLFFVLLDEMNLAPVEQYLAEFLSAMESVRAGFDDVTLPLYTRGAKPRNAQQWPAELRFPTNLFVIGTVNVDETTRPLSDRVIDRANLLQLKLRWSRGHHEAEDTKETQPWVVDSDAWRALVKVEPSSEHHDILVGFAEMLELVGIGVGLRSHVEIERFLANAEDILESHVALDMGVLQRIIPKVRGFKRELTPALEAMREALVAEKCGESLAVVDRWLDPSVSDDAYIDGTAPHIGIPR